jgi:hypothetical protein
MRDADAECLERIAQGLAERDELVVDERRNRW